MFLNDDCISVSPNSISYKDFMQKSGESEDIEDQETPLPKKKSRINEYILFKITDWYVLGH